MTVVSGVWRRAGQDECREERLPGGMLPMKNDGADQLCHVLGGYEKEWTALATGSRRATQMKKTTVSREKSKKKGKSGLPQPSSVNNSGLMKSQIRNLPGCSMPVLRGWGTGSRWDGQVRVLIRAIDGVSNDVTQEAQESTHDGDIV